MESLPWEHFRAPSQVQSLQVSILCAPGKGKTGVELKVYLFVVMPFMLLFILCLPPAPPPDQFPPTPMTRAQFRFWKTCRTPILEGFIARALYCFLHPPKGLSPPQECLCCLLCPIGSSYLVLGLLFMPFVQTPFPYSWAGIPFSMPELICKLQHGEDPCMVEREIPQDTCLGE